ncbi:hypothetical protein [Scytonema sp. HK-05]|uniref:hypothetical protein n=1 Tax=Scytonema sp. HK-05 TaxID=1137095 RepID=UPI001300FF80|nr:hypothetical protein [Scytonema sp. HK-05]
MRTAIIPIQNSSLYGIKKARYNPIRFKSDENRYMDVNVETLPFGYAFGTLRERQSPAAGNPPAALDSHATSLQVFCGYALAFAITNNL